jgi:hypothetical protein
MSQNDGPPKVTSFNQNQLERFRTAIRPATPAQLASAQKAVVSTTRSTYTVALKDSSGKTISTTTFDNPDKVTHYINALQEPSVAAAQKTPIKIEWEEHNPSKILSNKIQQGAQAIINWSESGAPIITHQYGITSSGPSLQSLVGNLALGAYGGTVGLADPATYVQIASDLSKNVRWEDVTDVKYGIKGATHKALVLDFNPFLATIAANPVKTALQFIGAIGTGYLIGAGISALDSAEILSAANQIDSLSYEGTMKPSYKWNIKNSKLPPSPYADAFEALDSTGFKGVVKSQYKYGGMPKLGSAIEDIENIAQPFSYVDPEQVYSGWKAVVIPDEDGVPRLYIRTGADLVPLSDTVNDLYLRSLRPIRGEYFDLSDYDSLKALNTLSDEQVNAIVQGERLDLSMYKGLTPYTALDSSAVTIPFLGLGFNPLSDTALQSDLATVTLTDSAIIQAVDSLPETAQISDVITEQIPDVAQISDVENIFDDIPINEIPETDFEKISEPPPPDNTPPPEEPPPDTPPLPPLPTTKKDLEKLKIRFAVFEKPHVFRVSIKYVTRKWEQHDVSTNSFDSAWNKVNAIRIYHHKIKRASVRKLS